MRRRILLAAILTGVLFGALAIPGTPFNTWLVNLLADANGRPPRPAAAVAASGVTPPLRVAIGAMVSPERTYLDYRTLFAAVARRAGARLELVQRRSYHEVNRLIVEGDVDLAWICTGAVDELAAARAATLVAIPEVAGRTTYRCNLVVPETSPVRGPADLQGAVMAFTDPLSLTGRKVIVAELARLGHAPESFFAHSFYTHAHDRSIRAVREGLATAATVDSLVWDHLARNSPNELAGLRIAWVSGDFPVPPLVAPATMDAAELRRLREILLALSDDPVDRKTLEGIGVDRFVAGDPTLYFPQ